MTIASRRGAILREPAAAEHALTGRGFCRHLDSSLLEQAVRPRVTGLIPGKGLDGRPAPAMTGPIAVRSMERLLRRTPLEPEGGRTS